MYDVSVDTCGVRIQFLIECSSLRDLIAPAFLHPGRHFRNREVTTTIWICPRSSSSNLEGQMPNKLRKAFADFGSWLMRYCRDEKAYERSDARVFYKDQYAGWCFQGQQNQFCIVDLESWNETGYDHAYFYYMILRPLMYEALWKEGRFFLHGAGLRSADDKTMLLIGDRNHGKTTLGIAGCLCGYKLLTDDTLICQYRSENGQILFDTIQREVHIDPELRHRLPGLSALEGLKPYASEEKEVGIRLSDLFPHSIATELCNVNVLAFPLISDVPNSSLQAMNASHAFGHLVLNSYTGLIDNSADSTLHQLSAFAEICRRAKSVILVCGRDSYDDPRKAIRLLEGAFSESLKVA